MKKTLCWALALMLALPCLSALAETASDLTPYLRVIGEEPLPVYEKTTDGEPMDALAPERLCGLIQDETATGGDWLLIIYVKYEEEKEAVVGYIRPGQTEQMTLAQFSALLQDPDKANEALDLLAAVQAYVNAASDGSASGGDGGAEGDGETDSFAWFKSFYDKAMKALEDAFNMDIEGVLGQVSDGIQEAADAALNAGLEIVGALTDGAGQLANDLGDLVNQKIEDGVPELTEDLTNLLNSITDTLDSLRDGAADGWDALLDNAGDALGGFADGAGDLAEDLSEQLNSLLDQVQGFLDGGTLDFARILLDTIIEDYQENGFLQGTADLLNMIDNLLGIGG